MSAPAPAPRAVRTPPPASRRVIPLRWPAALAVVAVGLVGFAAFTWPFFAPGPVAADHGNDAPWFFALLLGVLAVVCLAEVTAGRLDAKTVAVLGVAAAAGGALRLLSAGTAGLEPMFFVVIVPLAGTEMLRLC